MTSPLYATVTNESQNDFVKILTYDELPPIKKNKPNTALTDAYITAKIETLILGTKLFTDDSIPLVGINVNTNDGVVTISGHVIKQASIDTLLSRIKEVRGVKKIISNLTVLDNSLKSKNKLR